MTDHIDTDALRATGNRVIGIVARDRIFAAADAIDALRAKVTRLTGELAGTEQARRTCLSRAHFHESRAEAAESERDALRSIIAEAMRIPERHEAEPIFDPVRLHAFLKGREQAWDEFRAILSRAEVTR